MMNQTTTATAQTLLRRQRVDELIAAYRQPAARSSYHEHYCLRCADAYECLDGDCIGEDGFCEGCK